MEAIVGHLDKRFVILDSFATGSVPRYTAVRGLSDLDVLVALHIEHIKSRTPTQLLTAVRDCLASYGRSSKIRRDGQAITLEYETWPNVDVVPASRIESSSGGVSHYLIPDGITDKWITARPRLHDTTMSEANKDSGDTFKRLVKMMKWWNHINGAGMRSFHIEVVALNSFGSADQYPWLINRWFKKAGELTEAGWLRYEGSIADEYLTTAKRRDLIAKLKAAEHASAAAWYLTYDDKNEDAQAIVLWRKLFGTERFPAYG